MIPGKMEGLQHSAAVHMPLALAVLFPLLYVMISIPVALSKLPKWSYLILITFSIIQLVTTQISYQTGTRDRMLSSADLDLLANHQDLAGKLRAAWLAISLLLPVVFISSRRWSFFGHAALIALLAIQFWWAVQTGESGSHIVFGK